MCNSASMLNIPHIATLYDISLYDIRQTMFAQIFEIFTINVLQLHKKINIKYL